MSVQMFVLLAVCFMCSTSALLVQPKRFNFPHMKVKANNVALVAYSTFLASTPTIAFAEDGAANAVLVPLVISLLTIGPFLYYQQALKPKERKVQQIELDEYLRPVKYDKKGNKIK